MRALLPVCALLAILALPACAQNAPARFIKVDITSRNAVGPCKAEHGPTEVHLRMPITMAKGVLDLAMDGHLKLNGKGQPKVTAEQLLKLVADAKAGDLLLEITTNSGELVKIAVE